MNAECHGKQVTIHPGMMAYCRLLGRSWTHLTKVLRGERESPALLRRIAAECPELFGYYPEARVRLAKLETKQ